MALFANLYNPSSIFMNAADKAQLTLEERNYATAIRATEQGLSAAYPGALPGATYISWPDFEKCLHDKRGAPSGAYNNVYFERSDLESFGMKPKHLVGGSFAAGSIWKPPAKSPLPVSVDYVANPDLAAILIFAFLVIIFAVLVWVTYRNRKKAQIRAMQSRDEERTILEESDPFHGTAFESYPDPQAKCRKYVEDMEAQGYSMEYYRRQCGLPPK